MTSKAIAVVGAKPVSLPRDEMYVGVQVGDGADIEGWERDNTGINISQKNPTYCELTAHYWLWKNSDAQVKGLMHYRRILGSPGVRAVPFESMDERKAKALTSEDVDELLSQYDVILPKAHNYISETALEHYEKTHITGYCFDIIREYMKENETEYLSVFESVLQRKSSHLFNMFVSRATTFNAYSAWLFPVLEYVEERTDVSTYSAYEQRVYGYLSELLLDVWIEVNNFSCVEVPVLFLQHQNLPKRYAIGLLKKMGIMNPAKKEIQRLDKANRKG
ncbi:DUF4422 domain-containing protein [Bifidobacterium criceti]|nr:DUF4422 domain-containing protein [Bifidobacterium criceti]